MKRILLLFILLSSLLMSSQEQTNNNNKDEIVRIIKDNVSPESKIGTFTMRKMVNLNNGGAKKGLIEIKKVQFEIEDGFIKDIVVESENYKFSNSMPISLIKYSSRYNDKLYTLRPDDAGDKHDYIKLGEVLEYSCEMGYNFSPDNVIVKLPETKQVIVKSRRIIVDDGDGTQHAEVKSLEGNVFKDTIIYSHDIVLNDGISNLIDYRVYSDFLGLIESTVNGIVNFEAKVNIPVNSTNWSNFYILKSINPQVRYSRFDKESRVIAIDSSVLPVFRAKNKIELLQKSYISCGASLDLVTFMPKHSFVEFNIPVQTFFYLAEIIPGIKENISSVSYGGGVEMKINRSRNFGINFGYYINRLVHLYHEKYNAEKIEPFNYFNINSEVFFYGGKKSDALFVRFNYTSVFGVSNNFFQFQIGYKSGFNF